MALSTLIRLFFVIFLSLHSANSRLSSCPQSSNQSSTCSSSPRPGPCGDFCAFRLCNRVDNDFLLPLAPFILLREPTAASNDRYICLSENGEISDTVLTSVEETGEARVFALDDHFVPISQWRPTGLTTPFPRNALISRVIPGLGLPGLGRGSNSRGNQWRFLHDQCIILPIHRYRVLKPNGDIEDRTSDGSVNSCVAFRTTAPALHFRAEWDTLDDFDLTVISPDGVCIDFLQPRSQCGRLLRDFSQRCDTNDPIGYEDIVFLPGNDLPGRYLMELSHGESCTEESSRWTVEVIRNGVLRPRASGTSKDALDARTGVLSAPIANLSIRV